MPEISEEELNAANEAQGKLTSLEGEMGKLKESLDSLKESNGMLEAKLDDADRELLSEAYLDFKGGKGKSGDSGEGEDGKFDFNSASNAEMAEHLRGSSKKERDELMKAIDKKLDDNESRIQKVTAQLSVAMTAIKYPDFDENREAIYEVAKANPSWSAEKCYKQWKMESEKIVTDKVKAEKEKADIDAKALSEKGRGFPNSALPHKQLSEKDAAEAAFRVAFGNSEK